MKNVSLFTKLLVAASFVDCAFAFIQFIQLKPTAPRLAGGNSASPGQFPWIISFQYREGDIWKHDCGGALLDSTHVITAGHCVWNRNIGDMEAVAGAFNIKLNETTQQRRKVQKIFLHPNYTSGDGPGPFDMAIIEITPAFKMNSYVRKIEVAGCNEEPAKGEECIYAGWGNLFPISPFYYKGSDKLMTEPTTIISDQDCKDAYRLYKDALATAVCSRSGLFHGTCQGDSGGPLTCFKQKKRRKKTKTVPYLAGVVSFGFPVCNDGYHPDVYTSLGHPQICTYFDQYEELAEKHKVVWT